MKARESGMPDEQMWKEFFAPEAILDSLGIQDIRGNIVDFGCGYGTFTIPVARSTKSSVYAIDVENEMVRITNEKARQNGLNNGAVCINSSTQSRDDGRNVSKRQAGGIICDHGNL